MSSITVKQKLGVVALPYTLMFMLLLLLLIGLLVLVLVLVSLLLMSNSTIQQKLWVVAFPYTSLFMLMLVLVNISMYDITCSSISLKFLIIPLFSVYTCFLDVSPLIIPISCDKWC